MAKIGLQQITVLALLCSLLACGKAPAPAPEKAVPAPEAVSHGVDAKRLESAASEGANWLSYGRDYSEQRYSPLTAINAGNVAQLGLAWFQDMNTTTALQSTPLVIDGTIYVSQPMNIVEAFNAKTGERLWRADPKVDLTYGRYLCCGRSNRGLAAWGDSLFMGTLDARLVALDRHTGKILWDVATASLQEGYSITGAPRVIKGKVIIGNGGAEMGVRGFVSAYDAATGEMLWRFYTVPGNPADGFENDAMAMAADTWKGEWWTYGGGGTVWDGMAYDPELNQLYIGVGNGSPWNQRIRSPGGGDNLFLSSIVALNPDNGSYLWHYQTTPGETWDYTATQQIILADIELRGRQRKVLVQAPKNGFFYVIDRKTGEFISAEKFAPTTWASHVDKETGRPVETADARYYLTGKPTVLVPSQLGSHSWHPMAYSQATGYVYIPMMQTAAVYSDQTEEDLKKEVFRGGVPLINGALPEQKAERDVIAEESWGELLAWDPIKQQAVWRVKHRLPWNGGILATAGNLVFQGNADAEFAAYSADKGEKLWSFDSQTGAVAGPVSFSVDGEQYIAVMAGYGGMFAMAYDGMYPSTSAKNVARLLVFKLGAQQQLPPLPDTNNSFTPPPATASADEVQAGKQLYYRFCMTCHGEHATPGLNMPDLRASPMVHTLEAFKAVVLQGALASRGMSSFSDRLSEQEVEDIRAYIISEANIRRDLE